jgi:hypothetical protein
VASEPRFGFYERVVVASADPAKAEIDSRIGAILGRACDDHGLWSYAVGMYHSGICWSCDENELRSTGDFDRRESFYDGSSIRINSRGDPPD